jgi:hypothetical protein
MDKERFVERMLETENLTDELEDSDANWLLDWGTGQLDQVLQGIVDEEAAGNRVNALMAVMRKINRMTGSRQRRPAVDLSADLLALTGLFSDAFGTARQASQEERSAAATRLATLPTHAALDLLTGWGGQGVA